MFAAVAAAPVKVRLYDTQKHDVFAVLGPSCPFHKFTAIYLSETMRDAEAVDFVRVSPIDGEPIDGSKLDVNKTVAELGLCDGASILAVGVAPVPIRLQWEDGTAAAAEPLLVFPRAPLSKLADAVRNATDADPDSVYTLRCGAVDVPAPRYHAAGRPNHVADVAGLVTGSATLTIARKMVPTLRRYVMDATGRQIEISVVVDMASSYQIFVKTLMGKTIALEVSGHTTIEHVKAMIEDVIQVPRSNEQGHDFASGRES